MESEGKKAELTSGLRASMGKGTYGVEIIGNFNKNGDTPFFSGGHPNISWIQEIKN